jgi:adenylyltransferase/sulfurtransferase
VLNLIEPYDIIVDCSDNFEVRYVLSDACVIAGKPLVFGAAYQYEGQVAVWNAPNADGSRSPHYRDIFSEADAGLSADCSSGGVMPTLTGIIGCLQANEVIKYLVGLPDLLVSQLLIFDARTAQSRIIKLPVKSEMIIKELPIAVPEISVAKFLANQKYQLIDVRSAAEHQQKNIGGQLLPLEELLTTEKVTDFNKPTVFYCATGKRSATAVRYVLKRNPQAKVLSLAGGIAAWPN